MILAWYYCVGRVSVLSSRYVNYRHEFSLTLFLNAHDSEILLCHISTTSKGLRLKVQVGFYKDVYTINKTYIINRTNTDEHPLIISVAFEISRGERTKSFSIRAKSFLVVLCQVRRCRRGVDSGRVCYTSAYVFSRSVVGHGVIVVCCGARRSHHLIYTKAEVWPGARVLFFHICIYFHSYKCELQSGGAWGGRGRPLAE